MFISEHFLEKHQKKCIHRKFLLILKTKLQLRTTKPSVRKFIPSNLPPAITSLEFLKSEKGKPILFFRGHLFYKDRGIETRIYWKCQNYRKTKCAARVTTVNNNLVKTWKEHNHCGDAGKVEVVQALNTIRTYAETTNRTPHSIISNVSRTLSQAAAPNLPSVDTMIRTIRNIRNRKNCRYRPF